jgi:hypothetical protein
MIVIEDERAVCRNASPQYLGLSTCGPSPHGEGLIRSPDHRVVPAEGPGAEETPKSSEDLFGGQDEEKPLHLWGDVWSELDEDESRPETLRSTTESLTCGCAKFR